MRDITEGTGVDEAFRGLLEVVPDAMLIVDNDGRIILANARVEQLFGHPRNELLGHSIDMLVPSLVRARHARHRAAYAEHPHVRPMGANRDLRALRRDGSEFAIEISLSPLMFDGEPFVCCAIRDITSRRESEAKLRASEERFQGVVEHASDGIFITDARGAFLDVNSAACSMLGYSSDALRWKTIADIVVDAELPRIAPEAARLSSPVPVLSEWMFHRKDGSVFAGEVSACRLPDGRLLAFLRDVTERKRAQQELERSQHSLAEAQHLAGMGSWEFDLVSDRLLWSDEVYAIFEFPREEGPCYERFLDRVHPDDRMMVDRAYTESVEKKQRYEIEHRLLMKDGRIKHVQEHGRTDYDATGRALRSVGTVQDVTARVAAEAERRLLEEELRQSQKMEALGTLAGGIAHDFNNILSAIIGNLELAADEIDASHVAQVSLREARNASRRARDLVGQILTFSRQRPQERAIIDLRSVVQESLSMLRPAIPAGVELVTTFAPVLPAVQADRTQMNQVLINLCTNAWQAMETRTGRIDIRLDALWLDEAAAAVSPELHAGHYVRLSVSDTGKGMDATTASRVFDPFFTTKSAGEGTGLGLAVVHGIMRAHGGVALLDAHAPSGTTFHLYFPALDIAPDPVGEIVPEFLRGHGQEVLYLDDEEQVVLVVCRLLEKLGYTPTGFTHPRDAINAVRENTERFALAILDYNMPEMSGLQVADAILRCRPAMPVTLSSGFVTDELRDSARALGVRDILYKPYTMHELGAMTHAVLGERGDMSRTPVPP